MVVFKIERAYCCHRSNFQKGQPTARWQSAAMFSSIEEKNKQHLMSSFLQ